MTLLAEVRARRAMLPDPPAPDPRMVRDVLARMRPASDNAVKAV